MPDEKEYQKQIADKDKKIKQLESVIEQFQRKGPQRLFWALNRKANEMEDILNATQLKNVFDDFDVAPKKFDRLRVLYTDAAAFAKEVDALRKELDIKSDEELDKKGRFNFIESIAEKRS
jgi:hypothetical protein